MSISFAYVRLFADAKGNSQVEQELALQLEPTNFVPPAPAIHVSQLQPAAAYAFLSVPAGYVGDWHPSPKRQWVFFLSGQMEFEVSRRSALPGSAWLKGSTRGHYKARAPEQSNRRRGGRDGSRATLTRRENPLLTRRLGV